jgi:hypothetical protein
MNHCVVPFRCYPIARKFPIAFSIHIVKLSGCDTLLYKFSTCERNFAYVLARKTGNSIFVLANFVQKIFTSSLNIQKLHTRSASCSNHFLIVIMHWQ